MLFQPNTTTTERETSFLGRPNIPEDLNTSSLYEAADIAVYQAMCDSMCATYQGVCANAPEIVLEGLGDMMKSAYEFFKSIIKKIVTFIKNTFNYLMSYVLDFDKFIDKYKANMSNFKPFEVSGFTYTIEGSEVDKVGIEKIINEYNSHVKDIKKMEMGDIQKIILDCKSKDELGKIRARISGLKENDKHVKSNKFTDAMMKGFHDGKTSKHTIKVDSGNINEIVSDYKNFKELIKDVKEEGNKIQSIFEDLRDFFKEMPHYEYADSDRKKVKTYTLSDGGDHVNKQESSDEDYDTDYYKKLTAYYNFLFRYSKDLMAIYTKAYQTKVSALKEAISFHTGVIRRALSPFGDKEKTDEATNKVDSEYTMVLTEAPEEGFLFKDREDTVTNGAGAGLNRTLGGDAYRAYSRVVAKITDLKHKHDVKVLAESDVYKNARTSSHVKGTAMAALTGLVGGPVGMAVNIAFFRKLFTATVSKDDARKRFLKGEKPKFQVNVYYGENITKFIRDVNSQLGNVKVVVGGNTYVFHVSAKKVSDNGYDFAQVWVELKNRPIKEEFDIYEVDSSKPLVDSAVTEATNYDEILEADLLMERYENYYRDFNQYINEIEVLGEAYHRGMIMMEEVEIADKDNKGEERGFFQSIIDFIKKMINAFMDKAKNLFKSNSKWFSENDYKFDELSADAYAKLTITIVDYEKGKYTIPTPGLKNTDKNLGSKGYQTVEDLGPKMFRQMTSLSGSGDLVEGAKIFYRGGSNNLVKFTAGAVKPRVDDMRQYCKKYGEVADGIRAQIDKVTKSMEDAQEALTNEQAKESYSIAEGDIIEETIFSLYPWIDSNGESHFILKEADEKPATEAVAGNKTTETRAPKASVTTDGEKTAETGETEERKKKREEENKKIKDAAIANKKAQLEYWKVESKVAASMLTIAEERYTRYVQTLHDVLNAAKVTNKKEPTETRS